MRRGPGFHPDQHGGLSTPVIVKNPRGLGLVVPDKSFTVHDVADICGRDLPLKVIEVALQKQVIIQLAIRLRRIDDA